MNNKVIVLLLSIWALYLSGLVTKDGRLLSLAVPLLVYLIIGAALAPRVVSLKAKRTIDKYSVVAEEGIETQIEIENQGDLLLNLNLTDPVFPSETILEGQPQLTLSLPPGEKTELIYFFTAGRGVYSWSSIRACASDPFGLFEIQSDIDAPGEVRVLPTPIQLRPVTLKPRTTLHAAGTVSSRLSGAGIDFWGIREFRPGDSLRRLNRRLTARHPRKIFTNEYEKEEIVDYGLVLDGRKYTDSDSVEEYLFECSVSAAAALSENFLNSGNRVSMLIFGDSITTVFPGYGKRHLNTLRSKLARAKLGEHFPFNYLDYFSTRLFPSRSLVIIFSPVHVYDLETYARLISYGYEVLLISPDPIRIASQTLPPGKTSMFASRSARVERTAHLKQLTKFGVSVIDWQVDQPLSVILQTTAVNMMRRRNL